MATNHAPVVVITGGSGAIGSAIGRMLKARGDTVCSIDTAASAPSSDLHIAADVSDERALDAAFGQIEDRFGSVTGLVNTAFVARRGSAVEFSLSDWDAVMRVNVTSFWLTARRAATSWIDEGVGGVIVNLSSICGSNAVGRNGLAYGVSKAAILQLTRELAVEWAQFGIRVNAVQPAQVSSPALNGFLADPKSSGFREDILRGLPLGRLAQPEDAAAAVAFLLSDSASFITGVSLAVDGGNLAMNAGATNPMFVIDGAAADR